MAQATKSSAPKASRAHATRTASPQTSNSRMTKKSQLIQMLSRKAGADLAAISKTFGWLPHTSRAALSGLRKAGFEITAEKPENGKPSCYRITATPVRDTA